VDDVLKVLDVSKYLDEHPGGAEVIMETAGKEYTVASRMFEDIGHSNEAKAIMKKYIIGELKLSEDRAKQVASSGERSSGGFNPIGVIFLLLAIIAGYFYSQQS